MQWTLVSLKKEKLLIPIYLLALVINLIANLFMIPRFGMLAAALNIGISEFIVLFLTSAVVLQSFRVAKKFQPDYA
jgi:O-antigen/teichoic acid export membrane protein